MVVVAYVLVVFLVPIYASDFAQGGSIGSDVATTPSGSQLVHVLVVFLVVMIVICIWWYYW